MYTSDAAVTVWTFFYELLVPGSHWFLLVKSAEYKNMRLFWEAPSRKLPCPAQCLARQWIRVLRIVPHVSFLSSWCDVDAVDLFLFASLDTVFSTHLVVAGSLSFLRECGFEPWFSSCSPEPVFFFKTRLCLHQTREGGLGSLNPRHALQNHGFKLSLVVP